MNPLVPEFLANQISPHTQKAYAKDLRRFFGFLQGKPVGEVTLTILLEYKQSLLARGFAKGTINRHLNTVKAYYKFLGRLEAVDRNPTLNLTLYKDDDYIATCGLSNDETIRVIKQARNLMHNCLLHLLFYLGLRANEARSILMKDLKLEEEYYVLTVNGKGSKRREIPIRGAAYEAVTFYLASLQDSDKLTGLPLLFSTRRMDRGINRPLSMTTITKIFVSCAKRAGIKKTVSPHSARVTCISNVLENGAPLGTVQTLGGWSTLKMITKYDRRRFNLKNSAANHVNYDPK